MNRRTLISLSLISLMGAVLINPAFAGPSKQTIASKKLVLQKQPLKQKVHRHSRGSSTFGTQSQGNKGLKHDSDEQLDVWVARCNKAGGGMILRDDGNYDCVGPHGYPIPW